MYDDNTNDNKGIKCDIASGQSATVIASHTGCCRSYFCLMNVRVPGGKIQTVANSKTVDDNYCGGQLKWRLGIENQTLKGSATSSDEFRLELIAG